MANGARRHNGKNPTGASQMAIKTKIYVLVSHLMTSAVVGKQYREWLFSTTRKVFPFLNSSIKRAPASWNLLRSPQMRLFIFGRVLETDPLKIVNNFDPINFGHKTKESVPSFGGSAGVGLKCPFFIYFCEFHNSPTKARSCIISSSLVLTLRVVREIN